MPDARIDRGTAAGLRADMLPTELPRPVQPICDECAFSYLSFRWVHFNFQGHRGNVFFLFHFSMKIGSANRIAPDRMPRFAPSHIELFSLRSHKKQG